MSEVFKGGFLGQLESITHQNNTLALHCSAIGLEEVFECFYYSTHGAPQDNPNKTRALGWHWDGYYAPGSFVFSFTNFLKASLSPIDCPLAVTPQLDVTIAPTFRSKGSIIVHPIKGVVISMDIKQHTSFTMDKAVSGEINVSHDFAPDLIPMYPILPFVFIYGEAGFFIEANGGLALEEHLNQSLDYDIHYEASYLPQLPMPIPTSIPKINISNVNLTTEHDKKFMVEGYVAGGLYGEIGIVPLLSKHIAKARFRFEGGIKLGGDAMLYNSDRNGSLTSISTYEKLKSGELYVKPFCRVGMAAKLIEIGEGRVNLYEKEWDLGRFKLVPDFTKTTLTRDEDSPSTLIAATTPYGSTIFPCTLGFRLFEGEEKDGIKGTPSHSYWSILDYPEPYFEYFNSQSLQKKHTVYPTVDLFGIEMLASPSAELDTSLKPVTLHVEDITETTAKVWGRIEGHELIDENTTFGLGYEEVGGMGTVSHDASSIDANGVFSVEFMALKPNTTYKYFAYLTIDGETYYGEDGEFTTKNSLCPDSHHPHAINLGLPSGTKWCCYNVGASTPEGYGGSYTWGETSEKSEYNHVTYAFFTGEDTYGDGYYEKNFSIVDIGTDDIAGTSYDVAHVFMGANWRMPSIEQIRELYDNCSHQYTQLNGVTGILVTGPSGNQIFLPAAGIRWDNILNFADSEGNYWSSTVDSSDNFRARALYFNEILWDWYVGNYSYRFCGHSVRAVCP